MSELWEIKNRMVRETLTEIAICKNCDHTIIRSINDRIPQKHWYHFDEISDPPMRTLKMHNYCVWCEGKTCKKPKPRKKTIRRMSNKEAWKYLEGD